MFRRLLVVFAVLAATLVGAAPASASAGTVTQTVHFSSMDPFLAFIPCSPLAGFIQVDEDNGNGVLHFAANSNGFWITGTYEGHILIRPATNVVFVVGKPPTWDLDNSGTRPSAQGHVADWFGESLNRTVVVDHDTVNAQATTSTGQAVRFHAVGHIQSVPNTFPPVVTHQFMTATCS